MDKWKEWKIIKNACRILIRKPQTDGMEDLNVGGGHWGY
jgi:hypothetical protein